jgi:hypothetical protein
MGILDNMALLQSGFFLEEAPCGSTGFFTGDYGSGMGIVGVSFKMIS